MQTKYDSYYEKEIPYKMNFEEFAESAKTEEQILAYIRNGGDSLRFLMNVTNPKDIVSFGGICLTGSDTIKSICKFHNSSNNLYNPLIERDSLRADNWYHPYKIMFESCEYAVPYNKFYFSDFCSLVRSGNVEIWEVDPTEFVI